jgi:hypothetical protein
MAEEKEKGFGGIFSGLKKMIFTEDYLASEQVAPATKPIADHGVADKPASATNLTNNSNVTISNTNTAAPKDMVEKIYGLLENINKPGIDFFELWNAAEAMGGPTPANIQNAFTTLKVLGLDKNTVLITGNGYLAELQEKIGADINSKQSEKKNLNENLANEKTQLQNDKVNLEKQIQELTKTLAETESKLNGVDKKYEPQIAVIDSKIQAGATALNVVSNEMKTVLDTINKSIN